MSGFGKIFNFTTFGESHGPLIGVVIDGVPSRIAIDEEYVQAFLDKRRPGSSIYTTARSEKDAVKIVSGVFEGQTTGTPLAMIIANENAHSKDYTAIKDVFRPAHADFTYFAKYGIRDYRGGGRSSARETAMRVAAGAVARKILGDSIKIKAYITAIGKIAINFDNFDYAEIDKNPFCCPDATAVPLFASYLEDVRSRGSSVGAVVEVVADNVPAGLGEPIYDKLSASLASAMMGINAVKGVEIGDGFAAAAAEGPDNADEMTACPGRPFNVAFKSNHAGGILGGISTGEQIKMRVAFKPTPSIAVSKQSVDIYGNNVDVSTRGRHDPCVGIRGVCVVEAMMANVLADYYLRWKINQC